jgi:hypothetical protein
MEKYIELKCVQELLRLIKKRDGYYDWSDSYQKYDRKVKKTIEWIERNAKVM